MVRECFIAIKNSRFIPLNSLKELVYHPIIQQNVLTNKADYTDGDGDLGVPET